VQTRRKRTRISGKFNAELVIGDQHLKVLTEDLSLKGVKVTAERSLEEHIDDACRLVMVLTGDKRLEIEAEIVRAQGTAGALEFISMDEDSYSHLRNIVRHAAPDADAIDREQSDPAFD
jgi:c-di-GMP-binding flagellar brake protein YcgR